MRHKTHIKHKAGTYEYNRAYYHLYRKPFRQSKDNFAEGRYRCVLCGFLRRMSCFKELNEPRFKVITSGRPKFRWLDPNFSDTRVKSLFHSYINTLVSRCREFLAKYDPEYKQLLLTQTLRTELGGVRNTSQFSNVMNDVVTTAPVYSGVSSPIVTELNKINLR